MPKWIEYLIIRRSGFFDEHYYLKQYPDVRRADTDPLMHYLKYGWKEDRNPGPNFNTRFYTEAYPDIQKANVNPLLHFIRFGRYEGRISNPRILNEPESPGTIDTKAMATIGIDTGLKIDRKDIWIDDDVVDILSKMLL